MDRHQGKTRISSTQIGDQSMGHKRTLFNFFEILQQNRGEKYRIFEK